MPELKLSHKVPITSYEGLTVKMYPDGSFDLLFHQKTDESGDPVLADVVSAVHVPDETRWDQIKELVDNQLIEAMNREK